MNDLSTIVKAVPANGYCNQNTHQLPQRLSRVVRVILGPFAVSEVNVVSVEQALISSIGRSKINSNDSVEFVQNLGYFGGCVSR